MPLPDQWLYATTLGYTKADTIINGVFAYASIKGLIPPFMFSVFQAFDAGDFVPGIRSCDASSVWLT
jgi:hypothetical protein